MQIYKVGGAVRDALLGLPVQDRDWVVVGATPEELAAQGFLPVGKDFPVFLHPETREEYALARTERKTARGYHGFSVQADPGVTLEQDLARRDLTINSMAQPAQSTGINDLIDPYHGQRDLQGKVLRHVTDAFREDPVRILRLARFAARFAPLGFTVAPETLALCRQMVAAGEVDALVPERVWQEMSRALTGQRPSVFFEVLHACGALARILPELAALDGVPQRADCHPEVDSLVHTLMGIDVAAREGFVLEVRTAVLLHDLGKAATPREEWPSHKRHDERGVPLVQQVCARLRIPKNCADVAVHHTREHLLIHRVRELRPTTLLELLERLDVFRRPDRLLRVCEASLCDARGRLHFEHCEYPQTDYLQGAAAIAAAVPVQAVIADGHSGAAVGAELRRRRLAALAAFKQQAARTET